MTSPLLKPLALGPFTLKNRVFLSALTRDRNVPSNVPTTLSEEYYSRIAAGGAGLIVTEGTLVSQQGTEWRHAPGIWNAEQVKAWKKVTDGVHKTKGAVIFVQLWHTGRVSHPDMPEQIQSGQPVYAPSAVSALGGKFRTLPGAPGYVTPTEIDDPFKLVELFRQGAINAKEAGFDGIELHGANGYLISQFLDTGSNKRTDKWGGSVENRSRFAIEVLKAVSDVYGPDRVGIKLSPGGGYNDMGMPLEETVATFTYLLSEIEKLKILYVDLVRYVDAFDPIKRGTKHDVVQTFSHLLKNTVAFSNCGYDVASAEKELQTSNIQGIFFGQLYIAHLDLPKRIAHGKPADNAPDYATYYGNGGSLEEQIKGYTDYPEAVY